MHTVDGRDVVDFYLTILRAVLACMRFLTWARNEPSGLVFPVYLSEQVFNFCSAIIGRGYRVLTVRLIFFSERLGMSLGSGARVFRAAL